MHIASTWHWVFNRSIRAAAQRVIKQQNMRIESLDSVPVGATILMQQNHAHWLFYGSIPAQRLLMQQKHTQIDLLRSWCQSTKNMPGECFDSIPAQRLLLIVEQLKHANWVFINPHLRTKESRYTQWVLYSSMRAQLVPMHQKHARWVFYGSMAAQRMLIINKNVHN